MQIRLDQVVKQYATVTAVNQVSFEVDHGEIIALLGPNGAGKSSIVRMLVGFTFPDGGAIEVIDGEQTYSSVPKHELGYLPEDRGLFLDRPLIDNLMYLAKLRGMSKTDAKREIDYWLERFELTDRAKEMLKSLSKGNQQKIQLISAVLHKPKVAILDEPFSGLDPINQEFLVSIIKELREQGMTILLSAHQMNLVERLADRLILMNAGKIVAQGTLTEIRQSLNDKQQLHLRFANPIDVNQLGALPGVAEYRYEETGEYIIDCETDFALNDLLAEIRGLGDIEAIRTSHPSLHELYLQAIQQHKQQVRENAA